MNSLHRMNQTDAEKILFCSQILKETLAKEAY